MRLCPSLRQPCHCGRGPNPPMAALPQRSCFCQCPESAHGPQCTAGDLMSMHSTDQDARHAGIRPGHCFPGQKELVTAHQLTALMTCSTPVALKCRPGPRGPLPSTFQASTWCFFFFSFPLPFPPSLFLSSLSPPPFLFLFLFFSAWLPGLRGHSSPHEHYCL